METGTERVMRRTTTTTNLAKTARKEMKASQENLENLIGPRRHPVIVMKTKTNPWLTLPFQSTQLSPRAQVQR